MAVYKQNLFTESVTAVTATNTVELGTRRVVDGKEYVYCYNGADIADKRLFVKPLASNSTGYTFTVTTVSNSVRPVIGLINEATCATASYCWVLVKGKGAGMIDGASTLAVGGAEVSTRVVTGADGKINIATGGTGTTGLTVGYLTTAISDVTNTSVGIYVQTGN